MLDASNIEAVVLNSEHDAVLVRSDEGDVQVGSCLSKDEAEAVRDAVLLALSS